MKIKLVLAAVPLVMALLVVNATAQVVTSFRWFNVNEGSLLDSDEANLAANNTVLTFLTGDNTFNPVTALDPNNYATWADVGTDFTLYRAMPNPGAGFFITDFMTEEQPDNFAVGQYAWAIVLDLPFASFTDLASIDNQIFYGVTAGVSPLINNLDTTPAGTPQSFTGFSVQTMEQIPEPSVFALMGLGGLLVMIRRRFVVKS